MARSPQRKATSLSLSLRYCHWLSFPWDFFVCFLMIKNSSLHITFHLWGIHESTAHKYACINGCNISYHLFKGELYFIIECIKQSAFSPKSPITLWFLPFSSFMSFIYSFICLMLLMRAVEITQSRGHELVFSLYYAWHVHVTFE